MNVKETVNKITIQAKAEGVTETTQALKGLQTAQEGVAKSSETLSTTTETSAKRQLSLANAVASAERKWVPYLRVQQEFEKVNRQMNAAAAQNPALQERASNVIEFATQRYNDQVAAIKKTSDATNDLRMKYNPLFAAGQKYKETLNEITTASRSGALTDKERADAIMNTKVAFVQQVNALRGVNDALHQNVVATGSQTKAVGLQRHELINLSRQFQDVGVSLQAGQHPMTILVQQGSQIADIYASSTGTIRGFFGQVVEGAKNLFTPMRLVTGAVVAFGAAAAYSAASWSSGQRDIERSLAGIGAASGLTRQQFNELAKSSSSALGLSVTEARETAITFANTGKIYGENIGRMTVLTKDFARATGEDVPDAAKRLAKMFSGDVAAGLLEASKTFGFLTVDTYEYVRSLDLAGDKQEAIRVGLDAMTPSVKKAAEQTGFLAKSWDFVSNAVAHSFSEQGLGTIGKDLFGVGETDEGKLERLLKLKTELERSTVPRLVAPRLEGVNAEIEKVTESIRKMAAATEAVRNAQKGMEARELVRSVVPQIREIEQLEAALKRLQDTQANPKVAAASGPGGDLQDAIAAISVQLAMTTEAKEEAARHNIEVSKIAVSYQNVGISTALVLEQQKGQLAVAQAVGFQAQQEAQYQATINQLLVLGKSLTEATATAAGQRAIAEAQVKAQLDQQILAAQGALSVAEARPGVAKLIAQEEARVAQLTLQTGDAARSAKLAALERAAAEAQIKQAIEGQIESLNDQYKLIQARQEGTEATVQAEIAYRDAIKSGATELQASQIAGATRRNRLAQEEQAQEQAAAQTQQQIQEMLAQQKQAAYRAEQQQIAQLVAQAEDLAYQWARIAGAMVSIDWYAMEVVFTRMGNVRLWTDPATGQFVQFNPEGYTSTIGTTGSGAPYQAATMPEMQKLQAMLEPKKLEIKTYDDLTKAFQTLVTSNKDLANSTDALNATIGNMLSPYYSQDPRTTKLGYRVGTRGNTDWMMPGVSNDNPVGALTGWTSSNYPGFANGGEFTVPGGYSSTDNKIVSIAARSGERVSVATPEQQRQVVIDNSITINGSVDQDTMRKLKQTQFQQAQRMRSALAV